MAPPSRHFSGRGGVFALPVAFGASSDDRALPCSMALVPRILISSTWLRQRSVSHRAVGEGYPPLCPGSDRQAPPSCNPFHSSLWNGTSPRSEACGPRNPSSAPHILVDCKGQPFGGAPR